MKNLSLLSLFIRIYSFSIKIFRTFSAPFPLPSVAYILFSALRITTNNKCYFSYIYILAFLLLSSLLYAPTTAASKSIYLYDIFNVYHIQDNNKCSMYCYRMNDLLIIRYDSTLVFLYVSIDDATAVSTAKILYMWSSLSLINILTNIDFLIYLYK